MSAQKTADVANGESKADEPMPDSEATTNAFDQVKADEEDEGKTGTVSPPKIAQSRLGNADCGSLDRRGEEQGPRDRCRS